MSVVNVICIDTSQLKPEGPIFAIVKISGDYSYYTFCVKRKHFIKTLNSITMKYPDCEVVYEKRDPNSRDMYNLMKEFLYIEYKDNYFNTNMSEDELLDSVENIYKSVLEW